MKSVFAFLIVIPIAIGMNIPSQGVNALDTVQPYYVGVTKTTCALDIVSGKAVCEAIVILRSNYSVSLTLKLQQSTNGTSWTTLKTWTTNASQIQKSYYVSSGYYYRTTLNVKAYNSKGTLVDNFTVASKAKSY